MSANNGIVIKSDTFEVYYIPCWDNGLKGGEKIGKGKNLEDAYIIAKKWLYDEDDEDGFYWDLEYGIQIV